MRTLNSAGLVLVMSMLAAPVFAVGGVGGSGAGSTSGGVNSDSIDGARSQGNSDPVMEEQDELQKRKQGADSSIEDSDQAGTSRDRRLKGDGSFSAGQDGVSGSGSADTEEAEE